MQAVLFTAGLGDVIRSIYMGKGYRFISEVTEPVKVLCASQNPFALEIFRHHRNAKNFILHDLGHKFDEYQAAGLGGGEMVRALCEFAGIAAGDLVSGPLDAGAYVPEFDAPDDVDSKGHVVFQPFTGSVASRVMPIPFLEALVERLRALPCRVFIVTRSYPRRAAHGRTTHAVEDARRHAGGNITVLEHLSVPATLNLVKTAAAYVGNWSSLHQAAWLEHKPVAVFHPPNWCDVVNRTGYAFGLDRENTFHADWQSDPWVRFDAWARRWILAGLEAKDSRKVRR
jgi:hypothetical protein